ncbi:amidophosphoribosyltransferase [Phaeodactylibacter luteus]|uniref:Amidophosphoribosyltransferase n=1 Tax=Phaeodactylibacter luteus TaxID=1564516 RepID=A0A5C6RKD4_9BACT|nr:amidophosphoribosyltransferase [Phaeodactylibacter luteus]TXB62851.1 amidophosphoribosyltransferase [Phaeodactylibacter luteus]
MSEQIKHECGIAMIRLLKPLDYYQKKYGTAFYGINQLQLLMQKQRNRGQDGAGMATIKLDVEPGKKYISRKRSVASNYLDDLFKQIHLHFQGLSQDQLSDATWLKDNKPYMGELLLGHLRYGTHGDNSVETCHPFLRQNNWVTRNLILAGNFNLTNVDELFQELVDLGQYPKEKSDTVTVLEKIGHFLDDEVQRLHTWYKPDGYSNREINELIYENLDIQRLLRRASKKFDGGFVMAGLIGHGDAFVLRDPAGIRPAFYYQDDEVVVVASERPAIQTVFNKHVSEVKELQRGHALIVKKDGRISEVPYIDQLERRACSFERIYFSRGNDRNIYLERKQLGRQLTDAVLEEVDYDFRHSVFSFVPNTAETAFYGLMEGLTDRLDEIKRDKILKKGAELKPGKLEKILSLKPRMEKLIVKDAKQRTFIADTRSREAMVAHVYDVTYGIVENDKDTLVLLDDSIVRGTTLKDSIIQIASRLRPKKIVIVSSAPQIRYPDCYGIDMSKMKEFVAFRALVELLKENGKEHLLQEAYERCKAQEHLPKEEITNEVRSLYDEFPYEAVSDKIAEIVTPKGIQPKVKVIYQTIEGLREACPENNGDWYFSGEYPTPGGNKVVNRAFINFMEGRDERGYL